MKTNTKISSEFLKGLYKKENEDEDVFALTDVVGIHVAKKYKKGTPPFSDDRRMLISLHIKDSGAVNGGVNMVKARQLDGFGSGYPIVFRDQKSVSSLLRPNYENFRFFDDEGVVFDFNSNHIRFRDKEYSINDFILKVIVKNHISTFDMFWTSRISAFFKNWAIVEPVFWLVDGDYKKDRLEFLFPESSIRGLWEGPKIREAKDPFFKYFDIYKNVMLLSILYMLTPIFWLSIYLSPQYFSVTNPFFLLSAFGVFALLERFSEILFKELRKKGDGFVFKLAESTLELRGKLKV